MSLQGPCVCMHACHHSRIHTNIHTAGNRDGLNLPLAWCALGHAYGRRYAACTRHLPQHSGVAPSGPPSAQQQHKHDSGPDKHESGITESAHRIWICSG